MAIPNPERELARLQQVVEAGLPAVVVIFGASSFFRSAALELILSRLPASADVRRVAGDSDTSGEELLALRGGSLFGASSCLVVRRAEGGWLKRHGDALLKFLPKLAKGCGLVLEAASLDRRTKLGKALVEAGSVFEFRNLYTEPYDRTRSPLEGELVQWIGSRARTLGLPLTPPAALLVMTTVGTEPAECLAELVRLRGQFPGVVKPLTPDELRSSLSCSFESTPFELAEAILDNDQRRAERSLEAMLARGVRGREGDSIDRGGLFPFATSWLFQALAQAYEGRFLLQRGVPLRDVAARAGVRMFVERYQQQVQQHSQARLSRGLLLLHQAQRELRQTGEDPEWILRRFVGSWFAEASS